MLFRSKTAIKDFFSQLFNFNHFNGNTSVKTQKSAIITKLSNDYNAEQNDNFSAFTNYLSNVYKAEQYLRVKSQLDCNDTTPPSGRSHY